MTMHSIKPEWDTPPNGDFASYVERLSAQQALQSVRAQAAHSAQVTQPHLPAGVAPGSAQAAAHRAAAAAKAVTAPGAVALPPDLVQLAVPFVGMLRIARTVLAFLAGVHALSLVLAGQGSWFALVVMGMLWWGIGLVIKAAAPAGATAPPAAAVAERLRQGAQQRKTGNKK